MGKIFNDSKGFRQYRYHVTLMEFLIPGKKKITIPPERMIRFNITHDYEGNAFPEFRVTIALESDLYYKILKYKNKGQFHLRIDTFYTGINDSNKSIYKKCINGKFDLIMDDDTDDMLEGQKKKESEMNYTSQKNAMINELRHSEDAILNAYLYKSKLLDGTKTLIGKTLNEVTVTDAIVYCFKKAKLKDLIMAKPDNNSIYHKLQLPRMSMVQELAYIDSYYGLYKEGSLIYFDFDSNYIIPYNGKCEAYVKKKDTIVSILIPETDNSHLTTEGILQHGSSKDKNYYIVGNPRTVDARNGSITNNYIMGNDAEFQDAYDGTTKTKKSSAKKRNKNFARIQTNRTENNYLPTTYASQTKALSTVINVDIGNCLITQLDPTKRIKVVFENTKYAKKYKGNYILSRVEYDFIKDGEDFMVAATATLKRE